MAERDPCKDPQVGDVVKGRYWTITVTERDRHTVKYAGRANHGLNNNCEGKCGIVAWKQWCKDERAKPVAPAD